MATNISIGNYISRGRLKTHPFHKSLIDYWNFSGKSNTDIDNISIKGIKGNELTAHNFNWSLNSGYGLYKEDYSSNKYRKFNGSRAVFTVTDNSIHITESLDNSSFIETPNTQSANAYSIEVTGLKPGIALEYKYVLPDVEGLRTIAIVEDGVYNLPQTGNSFNGFRFTEYLGACNITIKQIPEYEGAIVTDGIDDYLKFDKLNYKIGTVIVKHKPIGVFPDNYRFIFDVHEERSYLAYEGPRLTDNFDNRGAIGDYYYVSTNNPRTVLKPLYIGSMVNTNYLPMALYEIAIYQDVLTDEQVTIEIEKLKTLNRKK